MYFTHLTSKHGAWRRNYCPIVPRNAIYQKKNLVKWNYHFQNVQCILADLWKGDTENSKSEGQLFILVVWGSKSEGQLFILVLWGEQYIEEIDNRICIDTYVSKHVHSLSDSNHISHLLPWCHSRGDLKKPHYRSNVSDPMSWPFPRNENTKLLCDLFVTSNQIGWKRSLPVFIIQLNIHVIGSLACEL